LRQLYPDRYHEVVFTRIWQSDSWGGSVSKSGPGSNLQQTAIIRREIADLLHELQVRRFLDVPCGDFNWMKEVSLPPGVTYLGGDIVEEVIRKNNERYGNPVVSFTRLDILAGDLPQADLVLCRDCLVH